MKKEETKFLIINTESLWKQGVLKKDIKISQEGISIEFNKEISFINAGSLPIRLNLIDFAIDSCGVFYLLVSDNGKDRIVVYDKDNETYKWINCIYFTNSRSIAVSDSDVFIANQDKIICLARANYQIRWERDIPDICQITYGPKDCLYLLDTDRNIRRLDLKSSAEQTEGSVPAPVSITSDKDYLYVLSQENSVYKISTNGDINKSFIQQLPIPAEFIPSRLSIDTNGIFYIYGSGKDKLKEFILINRENRFYDNGIYLTRKFNSTIKGCHWHRIILGADYPENTRIELSFAASDNEHELPNEESDSSWSKPVINPTNVLIYEAKGQYIRFKINFFSDDLKKFSPIIRSLRVEFPHHSYLRYLPAVYQENETGKEFLSRFLPVFETFFSELERKIFNAPRYFDDGGTPDEFLPWLSQWLAISYDENWDFPKIRRLINNAPRLYKMRGTREGIEGMIEIFVGDSQPIIIEGFQMKRCKSDALTEQVMSNHNPYSFCVFFKPFSITTNEMQTVKRIVETEKPAHTTGHLKRLEPWFYLGAHTYLGINTILTEPVFVLGESVLSRDTTLSDREWSGQIDVRARIGEDTILT